MRGATHAVSGAAAGTLVALIAPSPELAVVSVGAAAVAALGPDIDHPHSPAARFLGPISMALCYTVRGLSKALGLPAHRGLSHTALVAVVVGAVTALLLLPVSKTAAFWIGLAVSVGWFAALLGDWMTKTSLPHLWWPVGEKRAVRFKCLRVYTGGKVEQYVVMPVSVLALVFGLWLALVWAPG